jgi:hypothetical protein
MISNMPITLEHADNATTDMGILRAGMITSSTPSASHDLKRAVDLFGAIARSLSEGVNA